MLVVFTSYTSRFQHLPEAPPLRSVIQFTVLFRIYDVVNKTSEAYSVDQPEFHSFEGGWSSFFRTGNIRCLGFSQG